MLRLLSRCRSFFGLRCSVRSAFTADPLTESKGQFYYVIPEIPRDSSQDNPLLQCATLPRIDGIKAEQIFTAISKQIIEYQIALSQLAEDIKSNSIPITYESIVSKIDEIIFPVQNSLQLVESLGVTNNDPAWRLITSRLTAKFLRAQSEHLYSNAEIYGALHKVLLELRPQENLKRGVVEQLLAEGWSNGAALASAASGKVESCSSCGIPHFPHKNGKESCRKSLSQLFYLRSELMKAENMFEQMVTNSAYVSSPETISQASITGRYDNARRIGAQLPSYLTNVLIPNSSGYIPVAESDLSSSAPYWFPYALGGKQEGGYFKDMRVNLGIDKSANMFLCHCSNRELRRVVWQALVQRASQRTFGGSSGQHASNDGRIEQMRRLRAQVASTMGAPDWLSLVWRRTAVSGRGPSSPDDLVDKVLEPIRKKLLPLGKIEWTILNEWAESHLRISPSLEHYDIAYAIEQYNFTMSLAPGSSLSMDPRYRRVLPFEASIDRIFGRLGDLFGLTVARLPVGVGHATRLGITDSFSYEVVDAGGRGIKLGEILVDLNPKHHFGAASFGSVTPVPLVTRFPLPSKSPSSVAAEVSIACMFGNLSSDAIRIGLSEIEALDIASAFGRCLQHVVSRTPSYAFTGLTMPMPGASFAGSTGGIPVRDNSFLTQDLIKLLLIRSGPMRQAIFGDALGDSGTNRVVVNTAHGISRVMALPFLRTLYESRFDLELWAKGRSAWKTWHALSESLWLQHMPYPYHPDDQWACSALGIFGSRGIPGMRYFEVWRQVIAFDCLSAFIEAGFDKQWDAQPVKSLFIQYRKTVLDPGTALSCRSTFQAFRGRDPLPDALLKTFDVSHKLIRRSAFSSNSVPPEAVATQ
ncbi:oligopeptidase [Echinococcus multilocularis]|uniref:Oligopeptidase n=1 Tax=Echinococcus multilocularis TaxID=6211 RepID=A0A068Y590_ECHMU|nr:oligopeptidase [Echinococcus multilocularis]